MKPCVTCHEVKPLSAFNVMRSARDGRQARCRDCCKAWYLRNSEAQKRRVAARNKRHRLQVQAWLAAFLLEHPCVDCGEADIRCLDFDHRPGSDKVGAVVVLVQQSASLERVQQEIEKCDVRCASCHRRRTAERAGFWRQGVQVEAAHQLHDAVAARLSRLLPGALRP